MVASNSSHAARRHQAVLWVFIMPGTVLFYVILGIFVMPHPPPGMGFVWPAKGQSGMGLRELEHILLLAAAITAAMTAFQELAWRPWLGDSPNSSEKIFFSSSVAVRLLFLGTLCYHHFGPGAHDTAVVGDGAHRAALMGLFYAAYSNDLVQMLLRPRHFASSFISLMVPHHVVSLAWFGLWMAFLGPSGPGGAPIWNTAIIYLSAAVSNHTFKLVTCYFKPTWSRWLVFPATAGHWLILLLSQGYYFSQCPCSTYGCWYPGSVVMLTAAWAMVIWDLPYFFSSLIINYSQLMGARITLKEIVPLLVARAAPEAAARAGAAAASAGADAAARAGAGAAGGARGVDASGDEDGGGPIVTAELVLRPSAASCAGKPRSEPADAARCFPPKPAAAPRCGPGVRAQGG